MLPCVR